MASDRERSRVETQGVPTGRRRTGLLFAAIRERFLGRGPGVLCFVLARAHHALARGMYSAGRTHVAAGAAACAGPGESERERAWYPKEGSVCSAVVAHHTISQVCPAHHTVILESLQRRTFYPRPRRPHVAFRPRSSSAHPDAHHPRPASIRSPTLLPPPQTPTRCRRARRKPCNVGLDAAAPSPRPRRHCAHPNARHP